MANQKAFLWLKFGFLKNSACSHFVCSLRTDSLSFTNKYFNTAMNTQEDRKGTPTLEYAFIIHILCKFTYPSGPDVYLLLTLIWNKIFFSFASTD
jgi:hypothetical protein